MFNFSTRDVLYALLVLNTPVRPDFWWCVKSSMVMVEKPVLKSYFNQICYGGKVLLHWPLWVETQLGVIRCGMLYSNALSLLHRMWNRYIVSTNCQWLYLLGCGYSSTRSIMDPNGKYNKLLKPLLQHDLVFCLPSVCSLMLETQKCALK